MQKCLYSLVIAFVIGLVSCSGESIQPEQDKNVGSVIISDRISNLNINAFAEDTSGHIWIATDRGLNRFTGHEFYQYYRGDEENTLDNNSINSFLLDKDGNLWVATVSGVCRYNGDDTFTRVPLNTMMVASSRLVQLEGGQILVRTSFGEWLLYSASDEVFNLISVNDPLLSQVPEPDPGPDLTPYLQELPFRATVGYKDSKGNIWIGSNGHGYRLISGQPRLFNRNYVLCEAMKDINVISLDADDSDGLWMAATDNRLFHAVGETVSRVQLPAGVSGLRVLLCDNISKDLWIGAGNTLLRCSQEEPLHVRERFILEGDVRSLTLDGKGTIYAGLSNGSVFVHGPSSVKAIKLKSPRTVYDLKVISDGSVWITQFRENISVYNPDTGVLDTLDYKKDVGEAFHLLSIFEDQSGDIYFPTRDYDLLHYDKSEKKFDFITGFSCSRLAAIGQTAKGDMWLSSNHGLNLWKRDEGKIIPFFSQSGIGGDQFNGRAVCTLSDGTVVFGGTHGITTCHEVETMVDQPSPLLFEHLLVNNTAAPAGSWKGSLYDGPQVRLAYNQNTLTISYASLDYPQAQTSWYSYKLEGFDKMTYTAGNEHVARYSNLPPGKYRFHLWHDSVLGTEPVEAVLPITIRPAPWMSLWAFIIYALILAGLLAIGIWFTRREIRMKVAMEQSVREKEHEQYVNRMNMNFFANMAHEFRTPLTMIAGPISQLRESDEVGDSQKRMLGVVQLSVDRMMKLANHLLDFNKLDADALELKPVANFDLAAQLRKTAEMFSVNAKRFGIRLETEGLDTTCRTSVDPDQLESIMENLLSNAFKYADRTDGEGWVCIRLLSDSDRISIQVENKGNPIPAEQLQKIFDRYYQIREHADHQLMPGTGIGLYYAKALAEKMGGDLTAENLEGTVRFTLSLPANAVDESSQEEIQDDPVIVEDDINDEDAFGKRTVLVVDDDVDLANYMSMILSPYYKVLCAYDAAQASEIACSKEMPDLVLSDIVMPGTDGIELCKSLKGNLVTCHIPVILVTAKVGVDNEVQGLDSGADAYVTKPFDPMYILALIKSILRNRDLLKGELTSSTDIVEIDAALIGPQDKEFIDTLYKIMEEQIDNPNFDIQGVAEKMHVSRSKLFYKVRNLTGMSPLHLFRTYRLNVAANLLKSGKFNVSEVADKVGFSSLSYFSKSFKQQFGVLPKDAVRK